MINKDMYNTFNHIDFTYYCPDHFNQKEKLDYICSKTEAEFEWFHGDTSILSIDINISILVEHDAFIFMNSGQTPDATQINKSKKAYNLSDMLSWTYIDDNYWHLDLTFSTSEYVCRKVYIPISALKNNLYSFYMYNLRGEIVHQKHNLKVSDLGILYVDIDQELSNSIKPGLYKYSIKEINEKSQAVKTLVDKNPYILVK